MKAHKNVHINFMPKTMIDDVPHLKQPWNSSYLDGRVTINIGSHLSIQS